MADEDEDLIVSLADDDDEQPGQQANGAAAAAAQQKPPPVPGPGAAKTPAPGADTGLRDLEAQLNNERAQRARDAEQARRLAAERDQAIAFARQAEARGLSTFELQNETALNAANEQLDAMTQQQEAAMNDGDFKTAAELNRKMHRLGGQIALLERDKATLASQREQMKTQHARPTTQQPTRQPTEQQPTDPLERALQGRTEQTKAFLRKHPDLIRGDGSLKRTAIDAHEAALDAGHQIDSPGYFSYIEGLLGGQSGGGEVRVPPGRAPKEAAPASRGGAPAGSGGSDPGTFTMTPKMRRLAEEQGVSPKEWAQNYVRLLKEGRITPIT